MNITSEYTLKIDITNIITMSIRTCIADTLDISDIYLYIILLFLICSFLLPYLLFVVLFVAFSIFYSRLATFYFISGSGDMLQLHWIEIIL